MDTDMKIPYSTSEMLDFAWAAGFVDGDGSVFIAKGQKDSDFRAGIAVSNTNYEALEKLREIFMAGSIHTNAARPDGLNKKALYIWHTQGNRGAAGIISKIFPFLVIKRERARIVLKLASLPTFKGRPVPMEIVEKRKELYEQCKRA